MGLIALVLPASPMIHMVRHPLDVVLSVFSRALGMDFACDIESVAQHYVLVADFVDTMLERFDARYLRVRYEELVADHEGTVRRVLEFVGAEFDQACLNHHLNPRPARTVSYAQVAEPLYGRACYHYRNYLRHLEAAMPILQPVMQRWGYVV
jgi:hypothetical protein